MVRLEDEGSQDSGSDCNEQESHQEAYSLLCEQGCLRSRQIVFHYEAGRHVLRLREPRGLYAVVSHQHQLPHWPGDMSVVRDSIQHLEWEPPEVERFYQPSGRELEPEYPEEGPGHVVYDVEPVRSGGCFVHSRVGGKRGPVPVAVSIPPGEESQTLIFESRFESGNLQRAVKIGRLEYLLTLRTDLYTDKHTQWYYFQVRNMEPGLRYRFTIGNLMKPSSLYSGGLRPLLYSETRARLRGMGWHRTGSDIRYYSNSQGLYSLTWTCSFPSGGDTCYLAHSYPYTYSDLQRDLLALANDPVRSRYFKLRSLCHSLAGNMVYVLTITSPVARPPGKAPRKRAVVVTGRVHPGETNSSWMMKGFLDYILGGSADAQLLRDIFIFKVVPMLNPDGVIVGNYRCSLTGRDLNRNYRTELRDAFPTIWHTRNMVKRLLEEREVAVYCDFHAHSRRNNVFMYGCEEEPPTQPHQRVFPYMLSRNASDKFCYRSCKFRVQRRKEGTGRIAMWRLGIIHSYTMEATFGGSTLGSRRGTHFTTKDLKSLGFHFCDTLLDYCDPDQGKFSQCLLEVQDIMRQEVFRRLERMGRANSTDLSLSDMSDLESSTSGSNSSTSNGPPAHLTLTLSEEADKFQKKKLRSRKERNRLRRKAQQPPDLTQRARVRPGPGPSDRGRPSANNLLNKVKEKPEIVPCQQRASLRYSSWIPQAAAGIALIRNKNLVRKAVFFEAISSSCLHKGLTCRGLETTNSLPRTTVQWDNQRTASVRLPVQSHRLLSRRQELPVTVVQEEPEYSPLRQHQHPPPFQVDLDCDDNLRLCLVSEDQLKNSGSSLMCFPKTCKVQRTPSIWSISSSMTSSQTGLPPTLPTTLTPTLPSTRPLSSSLPMSEMYRPLASHNPGITHHTAAASASHPARESALYSEWSPEQTAETECPHAGRGAESHWVQEPVADTGLRAVPGSRGSEVADVPSLVAALATTSRVNIMQRRRDSLQRLRSISAQSQGSSKHSGKACEPNPHSEITD